jgi:hypothetical protein
VRQPIYSKEKGGAVRHLPFVAVHADSGSGLDLLAVLLVAELLRAGFREAHARTVPVAGRANLVRADRHQSTVVVLDRRQVLLALEAFLRLLRLGRGRRRADGKGKHEDCSDRSHHKRAHEISPCDGCRGTMPDLYHAGGIILFSRKKSNKMT